MCVLSLKVVRINNTWYNAAIWSVSNILTYPHEVTPVVSDINVPGVCNSANGSDVLGFNVDKQGINVRVLKDNVTVHQDCWLTGNLSWQVAL